MTPTSTLSSSARRALRAAAHHLDPVVMIGQHGLTPQVLHEIDLALAAHALIKVRVQSDERETREAFLAEICQKMSCEAVQHLGKLLVLWRNVEGGDAESTASKDADAPRASKPGRGPRGKVAGVRSAPARTDRAAGDTPRARTGANGERYRYGDAVPPPPRREGWAPKNRRGAARFGTDDDATNSGGRAPRGRGEFSDGRAPGARAPAGRTGFGNRGDGAPPTGPASRRRDSDSGAAPGGRWGDRRDRSEGGAGGFRGRDGGSGGATGGGYGRSRDRNDAGDAGQQRGFADRAPRSGGAGAGGGGWGSRDNLTGKPRGFSRGGAAGAAAKPRARRRLG